MSVSNNDTRFGRNSMPPLVPLKPTETKIRPNLGIYAFMAGKGDCSLIVTNKYQILIDGGMPSPFANAWEVVKHLNQLTHIIVSHHDNDHVGGIIRFLYEYVEKDKNDWKKKTSIGAFPSLDNCELWYLSNEDCFKLIKDAIETSKDPKKKKGLQLEIDFISSKT